MKKQNMDKDGQKLQKLAHQLSDEKPAHAPITLEKDGQLYAVNLTMEHMQSVSDLNINLERRCK